MLPFLAGVCIGVTARLVGRKLSELLETWDAALDLAFHDLSDNVDANWQNVEGFNLTSDMVRPRAR